ncbi:MAG: helix-turn-helix transcriptional regulator [Deltaproteobacteria bacterium]|nr:helix-turn-helix transcriptional regulator [Deltaproteobacteria bacterium]
MAAAIACFAARGFSGTTTREIAARVGITEAALYRHFAGKEALYAAIIDRKMAAPALAERLVQAAARGDDRGVFGGLARLIIEALQADPAFFRILLYTALEGHSLAEPFFRQRMAALREFLAGYIARRTCEGAFRDVDPVLAARAFVGMIWDYVLVRELFRQKEGYPVAGEAAAGTFVSIFLDGVRAMKQERHG